MRIARLTLDNVTTHKHTIVDFPDTGLVLVTGTNGSGKSTLIEAVSVGGWDTPLRGAPLWNGDKCMIIVETHDGLGIMRGKQKNKKTIGFKTNPPTPQTFENNTKAQEALETVIGSHDIWKRSCVFSSSDAAHFTLATDSARKKLLETLLGLERFDRAYELARDEHRAAKKLVEKHTSDLAAAKKLIESKRDHLADLDSQLEEQPGTAEELEAAKREHHACVVSLANAEKALLAANVESAKWDDILDDARAECKMADSKLRGATEALDEGGPCPTCGNVPADAPDAHQRSVAALEAAKAARVQAQATRDRVREQAAPFRDHAEAALTEVTRARSAVDRASGDLGRIKRDAETRAKDTQRRNAVASALEDAEDEQAMASIRLDFAVVQEAELESAAKALSLSGVRAHLLMDSLHGIESVANAWLERVCTDRELTLKLAPYTEKASGGAKDSISLEIIGAGGGHGYKGASAGERRRIDVAILLALAEVAAAANGAQESTLWLDELFDALDDDGVDAVCDAVIDLAKTRCVVLLAHNPAVKAKLKGQATHLHVSGGRVQQV